MFKLRKIAAAFTALLLLCSCAESSPEPANRQPAASTAPAGSTESTVFGRNISYDAYTPAEDLSLPVPAEEISDTVQIEKRLYFLADGGVYCLDTETGESKKLFDVSDAVIAAHGGFLYSYSAEASRLCEYDPSGSLISELSLTLDGIDSVEKLYVTDSFFIFRCRITGSALIETHLLIYSRETCEQLLDKKAPTAGIELFPYKGDELLSLTPDMTFSALHLGIYDAGTGKNRVISDLSMGHSAAVAYSPKTDTVIVYGVPGSVPLGDEVQKDAPCRIDEYSLSDTDSILLDRRYLDVSYHTKFFINIYENAVFAVSTADSGVHVYDYLNQPKSITVIGPEVEQDVIYSFEKETGILVRSAHTEYDKLILKLMAGDGDFDLFNNSTAFHNYVDADTFVDLKTVESLESRISQNAAAKMIVSYDGKYFGVPAKIDNLCTEENFPENGSSFSYSLVVSEDIYLAENVDVAEKRYDDPDGDTLYKLFKYLNDNPTGNRKKMPFGDEVTLLDASVYMINPQSENRENAVRFLEYLFDVYNGDIKGVIPESDVYPTLESTENCYAEWRCRPLEIVMPIFEARNKILSQEGGMSGSELKKLAREAAAEVAMRIGE